jgi:putative DNA primase/helicase
MLTQEQWQDIVGMGIIICEKTGRVLGVDANIFASYLATRYTLIYNKENFYNYKDEQGKWVKIEDMKMKTTLRNILHKYYQNLWNKRLEDEYIEALKRTVFFEGDLNSERRYINMLNGMYDLEIHTLVEHHPNFYSTIQIPIEYIPSAECLSFEKFLHESFLGDEESKKSSQEWLGYSMTAETKAQKSLVLYGKGRNGKGVYLHILSKCIGRENISNIALTELSNSFMRSCLYNKLANICSEMELGNKSLNTQYFKMLTGEDDIMAEEKHKPAFSFRPTVKAIFATNNLPHTKDTSLGFGRRLSILHFRNTVAEKDIEVNLKEKLEEELSGIFNFAMEGLKRLKENNFKFTKCKVSEDLLNEYAKDINPMISFFEECIEQADESYKEDKKVIYNTFKVYADANGMKGYADISTRKFWAKFDEQFRALGYKGRVGHSNKFNFHTGVKVVGEYKIDKNHPTYKVIPIGG